MLASPTFPSLRGTGIVRSVDKSREAPNICETCSQFQKTNHCIHAARINNISPALSFHCAPMFPRWPGTRSRFKRPCSLKKAIETVAAKLITSARGVAKHLRFCVGASNFQIIGMAFRCYFPVPVPRIHLSWHGFSQGTHWNGHKDCKNIGITPERILELLMLWPAKDFEVLVVGSNQITVLLVRYEGRVSEQCV